ncbi:hypothetical protein Tco_0114325, partial [Tanacetum coccineum]
MGLRSTLDEGTHKSQPFPEGTTTDPEDSGGNDQPADKGLPSTASHEGTAKTTPRPEGLLGDKDLGETNHPLIWNRSTLLLLILQALVLREPDIEALQFKKFVDVQALLLFDDEMVQESDEEEVFEVRKYMDEDTQADTEVQSPPPNADKLESSPVQDTDEST